MVGGLPRPKGGWDRVPDPLPLLWRRYPGCRDHRVPSAARQRPVRDAARSTLYLFAPGRLRASAHARRPRGRSDSGRRGGLKTTRRPPIGSAVPLRCRGWLQLHDVLRRRTLLGLHDFELHALAFGQRLEPFTLNRGVMHEAVLAAVFGGDEAEPLGVVEPLHGTGNACHLSVTP